MENSSFVWHPFSSLHDMPIEIVRGAGALLYTADGDVLIDGISSWWVSIHGHAHPVLSKALHDQAQCLEHVLFAGYSHPWAVQLAAELVGAYPHPMAKVFYSDNGSTAMEVALKLALQYHRNKGTKKHLVVGLAGSYHGDTFGSMSISGRGLFTDAFAPWLFEAKHLPFPDEHHAEAALTTLAELLSTEQVAAFVFEPLLQGAAGMRFYAADWLDKAISMARSAGALCIADEVLTGFGRLQTLFACEALSNAPDIVALSKGLTGGMMPLGATMCNERITEAFVDEGLEKRFWHGHSYTAYPLACRMGLESLKLLQNNPTQRDHIIASHAQQVAAWRQHPAVSSVDSRGIILSIQLRSAAPTSYANPLRERIPAFFREHGVLLRPLGNVLYVLPPYVITPAQLQQIYSAIEAFLNKIAEEV